METMTVNIYPTSKSGVYWTSNGNSSSNDNTNGQLYFDNGRRQRVTFTKSSIFNIADFENYTTNIDGFKAIIQNVYLYINYRNDRNKATSANFSATFNNNSGYDKDMQWSDSGKFTWTNQDMRPLLAFSAGAVRYNITNLFKENLTKFNDTFYLWTTYRSSYGMDGTFWGTRESEGDNRIHLEIEYIPEFFKPIITKFEIDDSDFYKNTNNIPVKINFAMPDQSLWPMGYTEENLTFNLRYVLIEDEKTEGIQGLIENIETDGPDYLIEKNLVLNRDPKKPITYNLYVYIEAVFEKGAEKKQDESAFYLYRITAAPIPLSLSYKGNGVSIGKLTTLIKESDNESEVDKISNARFECHYPIIIFAHSDIPQSYGSDLPDGGINGQLFFKIPDPTAKGWTKLETYLYLE